jgi:acetylornithine/N-succinyldiaminopimelate aminotransferase
LLLNTPRPSLLRFMPALNLSLEEIDTMLAILENAVRQALAK